MTSFCLLTNVFRGGKPYSKMYELLELLRRHCGVKQENKSLRNIVGKLQCMQRHSVGYQHIVGGKVTATEMIETQMFIIISLILP